MPEKQIITDPAEAADIRKRLVDPRRIRQIALVALEDQPRVEGFKSENSFIISAWSATNRDCYAVSKELPEPKLSIHVGPGTGLLTLATLAGEQATYLLHTLPERARAFIQTKRIPAYPPNRSGPGEFCLVTIYEDPAAGEFELATEDAELVPEFNAAGERLIELPPETSVAAQGENGDLEGHLARNALMWNIWVSMGVTEQTLLPVSFFFLCASKDAAQTLEAGLKSQGLRVTTEVRRKLLLLKEWSITASEEGNWTLDRLQTRTPELHAAAKNAEAQLQAVEAKISANLK